MGVDGHNREERVVEGKERWGQRVVRGSKDTITHAFSNMHKPDFNVNAVEAQGAREEEEEEDKQERVMRGKCRQNTVTYGQEMS